MVERNLAKVEVESSRLFSRSRIPRRLSLLLLMRHITRRLSSSTLSSGEVAKRLCSGLQSRLDGFDSRPRLQNQDNRRLMPAIVISGLTFSNCRNASCPAALQEAGTSTVMAWAAGVSGLPCLASLSRLTGCGPYPRWPPTLRLRQRPPDPETSRFTGATAHRCRSIPIRYRMDTKSVLDAPAWVIYAAIKTALDTGDRHRRQQAETR